MAATGSQTRGCAGEVEAVPGRLAAQDRAALLEQPRELVATGRAAPQRCPELGTHAVSVGLRDASPTGGGRPNGEWKAGANFPGRPGGGGSRHRRTARLPPAPERNPTDWRAGFRRTRRSRLLLPPRPVRTDLPSANAAPALRWHRAPLSAGARLPAPARRWRHRTSHPERRPAAA